MEALVILLAEFIASAFVPMVILAAELAGTVLGVICELFIAVIGLIAESKKTAEVGRDPQSSEASEDSTAPAVSPKRRWLRRLTLAGCGVFAFLLVTAVIVNAFFFEPAVRLLLGKIESRTGISLTFESAEGSFFTGRATFQNAKIARTDHPRSVFDLNIETAKVRVPVWSLVWGNRAIPEIRLKGAAGEYTRLAVTKALPARKPFRIESLTIEGSELLVQDRTRAGREVEWLLELDTFEVKNLRSNWAVHDVLFRSSADGRIAGKPFSIENRGDEPGSQVAWRAEGLPVRLAGSYLGGPFGWMMTGDIDLKMDCAEQEDGETLRFEWQLTCRAVSAELPDNLPLGTRMISRKAVNYINSRAEAIPVKFGFSLDREVFHLVGSPESAGLVKAIAVAAVQAFAKKIGEKPTDLIKLPKQPFQGIKRWIRRDREKTES